MDPTFEVSLFKSSELETISRDYHPRERDYYHHNNINYNPNRVSSIICTYKMSYFTINKNDH